MRPFSVMRNAGSSSPATSPTFSTTDKAAAAILSESNKRVTRQSGLDQWAAARGTTGRSSTDTGGFYFEVEIVGGNGSSNMVGIGKSTASLAAGAYPGFDANGWAYYGNGTKFNAGSSSAYGSAYTLGDIIGVLIKNGKLYFRKNGTWIGDPVAETGFAFSGITGTVYPMHGVYTGGSSSLRFVARSGSLPSGATDWG